MTRVNRINALATAARRRRWTRGCLCGAVVAWAQAWAPARAADEVTAVWPALPPPDLAAIASVAGGNPQPPCPPERNPGGNTGAMGLAEVVTQVLCHDPRSRQSWARTQADAAEVDLALAAYRPTLSAGLEVARAHARLLELGAEEPDRSTRATSLAELDFTWLLFDFGQRDANTRAARQTLLAATAAHDANLQAVLLEASDAYHALINARSALRVATDVERFASQRLDSAMRKHHDRPTLDRADRLQARIAVAEAAMEVALARSELRRAAGRLASLMGESPDTAIELDPGDAGAPDAQYAPAIDELLRQAQAFNPLIRAAQARADAARAGVDAAQRTNRPQLGLVMGASREHDVFGARRRDQRIGLQMRVPLFDGFERDARQRAAEAELRAATADVHDARRSAALEVWDAFEALQAETATVEHASRVLEVSREYLALQQARYDGSPRPAAAPAGESRTARAGPAASGPAASGSAAAPGPGAGAADKPAADDEDDDEDSDEDEKATPQAAGPSPPRTGPAAPATPAAGAPAPPSGRTTGATPATTAADDDEDADTPDLIDVLDAHRTVADSDLKRLQSLANWRAARMRLAASLGQLGLWSVRKP